jgi:histone deacetylase complex regulatory component SIN3
VSVAAEQSFTIVIVKQVLDLLRKNPVKAVPIIVARLEQKGQEWRQARLQLRESWKETYDKCFYKVVVPKKGIRLNGIVYRLHIVQAFSSQNDTYIM